MIDRKFVFTAVNPVNGNHYTHENAVVFCAKDKALLPALRAYAGACVALDCLPEHIESIDLLTQRVRVYQQNIESRVPDTVGAEIDRCVGGNMDVPRKMTMPPVKTDRKPVGYIAFGGNPSGDLFPLTQYTGKTEREVGDKIMIGAKAEGWRGTVAERLDYLGWVILPVYMMED